MIEKQSFHKERFDVISLEKQKYVLDAAVEAFAKNGFNGTSINKVAKEANISIGAMYSYFDSKEDLFLTVVERMLSVLVDVLNQIDISKDIFDILNDIFYSAHDYATNFPYLNQIYLDMSTQSLSTLSKKISGRLESVTKNLYLEVIERSRASKAIDLDISDQMLSFLIDNLIMMYQFSYTSEYYKGRMEIFLGKELSGDHHKQINEIVKFLKNALRREVVLNGE